MNDQNIRVASYNIRKAIGTDRRRDPDRIFRVLSELSADVVALQEADRRIPPRRPVLDRAALRERTGLIPVEFSHGRESLGWHGNAILVRPGLEVLDRAHFDLPGLEPRGAVTALLRSGDTVFRIVGVHLGLLRGSRRAQLLRLSQLLMDESPTATVILGDFNERSLRVGLGRLSPTYAIRDAGPTFHSRRPTFALDRIAHTSRVALKTAGTLAQGDARLASDHLPIYADLAIAPSSAAE